MCSFRSNRMSYFIQQQPYFNGLGFIFRQQGEKFLSVCPSYLLCAHQIGFPFFLSCERERSLLASFLTYTLLAFQFIHLVFSLLFVQRNPIPRAIVALPPSVIHKVTSLILSCRVSAWDSLECHPAEDSPPV